MGKDKPLTSFPRLECGSNPQLLPNGNKQTKKSLDLGSQGSTRGAIDLTWFIHFKERLERRDLQFQGMFWLAPPRFKFSTFHFLNQNPSVCSPA